MDTNYTHLEKIKELINVIKNKNHSFVLKNHTQSNTLRNGTYKRGNVELDLSSLDRVLELNQKEKWILVEPKMTFERLCHYTLQHGLIPPVVPEFKTITVGGAIMGASLESSSHRWGQVNDAALEYELILGDGELIRASCEVNSDLFFALSGSYGTLALLTAVKLRLIEAKKWVLLTYTHYRDIDETVKHLSIPTESHFVEAIAYHPSLSIVIHGEMSDAAQGPLYRLNKAWSPWYVQHVRQTKNRAERVALYDYLFRFDRGAFWVGRYIHSFWTMIRLLFHMGIPKIGEHSLNPSPLFRFLFGWSFSSKRLYKIWHHVPNAISETLFFHPRFLHPHFESRNGS